MGKSEENWANFSVKMSGKKGSATVNCQAFRQGDSWRFTVVSLDSAGKRVYLCKWLVCSNTRQMESFQGRFKSWNKARTS